MSIAALVNKLREANRQQLETVSKLPAKATYNFDREILYSETTNQNLTIRKTLNRTVISLNFSKFQAREVVREEKKKNSTIVHHSPELLNIVPKGSCYAYDLIAYVGRRTYLDGMKLEQVQQELISQNSPNIPFSSLYEAQLKFLFYFGERHHQMEPVLKDYFHHRGSMTWLIDGTVEPGSPVFFGVKEAEDGIFLKSWKIPTENEDDIIKCLTEVKEIYGEPNQILHDLSKVIISACKSAVPGVPSKVCHQHLASDIGKDIYKEPHAALIKCIRAVNINQRLQKQRNKLTVWLRKNIKESKASLILRDLLDGKNIQVPFTEILGREVLLASHQWTMDHANDGHRQGFPFDPHLLYFHRRVIKVSVALDRLLQNISVQQQAPKVLLNYSSLLKEYVNEPNVVDATSRYEKAWKIFKRFRDALRFSAKGKSPMYNSYLLTSKEDKEVKESLVELRERCRDESKNDSDLVEQKYNKIVLTHLDKYWSYLINDGNLNSSDKFQVRTTNDLESDWCKGKRARRQIHGRSKLTRDFKALPEEYMLLPNLKNTRYINLVLGTLDQLPEKLANAGQKAGPFSLWRKKRKPLNYGRLPYQHLRQEDFIDNLFSTFNDQCESILNESMPEN